jgi:hypothetical protein
MPARLGAARFDAISRQWLDLAERRLRYYIDLYQSGRWQHYYTKQGLAVRMRDVIGAVRLWKKLAHRLPPASAADKSDLRPAA